MQQTTIPVTVDKSHLTTIGSDFKRAHPVTSLLKRQRIGEFGIGYSATVMFDTEQEFCRMSPPS